VRVRTPVSAAARCHAEARGAGAHRPARAAGGRGGRAGAGAQRGRGGGRRAGGRARRPGRPARARRQPRGCTGGRAAARGGRRSRQVSCHRHTLSQLRMRNLHKIALGLAGVQRPARHGSRAWAAGSRAWGQPGAARGVRARRLHARRNRAHGWECARCAGAGTLCGHARARRLARRLYKRAQRRL